MTALAIFEASQIRIHLTDSVTNDAMNKSEYCKFTEMGALSKNLYLRVVLRCNYFPQRVNFHDFVSKF